MADEKATYPMLPTNHWWALRKKFKQSIPGVVTDNYLATVLNMKVTSARGNVLPYLKQLGIIDEEGRTGERRQQMEGRPAIRRSLQGDADRGIPAGPHPCGN